MNDFMIIVCIVLFVVLVSYLLYCARQHSENSKNQLYKYYICNHCAERGYISRLNYDEQYDVYECICCNKADRDPKQFVVRLK